jgi:hypothetical protein
MNEKLNDAIDELVVQLGLQLQEVAETKRVINNLRKRVGLPPLYEDVDVEQGANLRPDQFYGKHFATAAQEYLERRKRACSAAEILAGLSQGGFDFRTTTWQAKDRLRMVAISLAKNNLKFHKLPNDTFGLVSWYPSVMVVDDTLEANKNGDK